MHLSSIIIYLSLTTAATAILSLRTVKDPAREYLTSVCYPNYSNNTRFIALRLALNNITSSLANSPFPCEQALYIENACSANGTTEIDFLAEQECLCNGAYFDVLAGCDACYYEHGYTALPPAEASSSRSSLSVAECGPTPPYQPFSNLLPAVNATSIENAPAITLGTDRFPNNTAVSNYWTAAGPVTPGAITGSATG
ncbi:uncharacterized protein CDV56_100009, partial [Aspergillus thermomutatus]